MKITRNSIILTNRESRDAGHHKAHTIDAQIMDSARQEIKREASKLARFNNCHVEVFATQRGAQPWVVYACDHAGSDL